MTTRASSVWNFEQAWDDYQLPKPFAKVEVVRGDPISVQPGGVEEARTALERALHRLENS